MRLHIYCTHLYVLLITGSHHLPFRSGHLDKSVVVMMMVVVALVQYRVLWPDDRRPVHLPRHSAQAVG